MWWNRPKLESCTIVFLEGNFLFTSSDTWCMMMNRWATKHQKMNPRQFGSTIGHLSDSNPLVTFTGNPVYHDRCRVYFDHIVFLYYVTGTGKGVVYKNQSEENRCRSDNNLTDCWSDQLPVYAHCWHLYRRWYLCHRGPRVCTGDCFDRQRCGGLSSTSSSVQRCREQSRNTTPPVNLVPVYHDEHQHYHQCTTTMNTSLPPPPGYDDDHHNHQSTSSSSAAPTVMLVTTSVIYALLCITSSTLYVVDRWTRNIRSSHVDVLHQLGLLFDALAYFVFAYNFFVYLITCKQFRSELHKLFCSSCCCSSSSSTA